MGGKGDSVEQTKFMELVYSGKGESERRERETEGR